ncbi:hypothetical protein NFIA_018620 [Paecilomyces variotii No. 5]|uniref:Chalcone isomerase domain-containing protein n=1 Tax=Byssochlamys spectabilis (strain No. 5 / NBRC 109023) TaxID=1356009 RepID=V5HYG4_BYSSN|nr:hypothetical protein NFIA_018620 [Paecilomyces variotii No. 5]
MKLYATSLQAPAAWRQCCQCLRGQRARPTPLRYPSRFLSTAEAARPAAKSNPLRATNRAKEQEQAKYKRSIMISAAGIGACAVAMYGVIKLDLFGLEQVTQPDEKKNIHEKSSSGSIKLDGPSGFPSHPSVIPIHGQDGLEQVPTGNSAVPNFPTTITLPKSLDPSTLQPGNDIPLTSESEEEYELLGLGIRTVSFLSIQVYVVGLYVAKSDISALQHKLVRAAVQSSGAPSSEGSVAATSLIPGERQALRELLLDPSKGEETWDSILKEGGVRTAFRIVPTRNTDFMHLRDGWVRGITARAQKAAAKAKESGSDKPSEFSDESFGNSMADFKALFGGGQRKNVPKGQILILLRDERGALDALFQPDPAQPIRWLGRVADERISRLVWENYLAGKTVSSESARQSVVDGVVAIVERPVGTVVQRVV